jgi:hypothetical protein
VAGEKEPKIAAWTQYLTRVGERGGGESPSRRGDLGYSKIDVKKHLGRPQELGLGAERSLRGPSNFPFVVRGVTFAQQLGGPGVAPHSDGRNFTFTAHLGLQVRSAAAPLLSTDLPLDGELTNLPRVVALVVRDRRLRGSAVHLPPEEYV